MTLIAHRPTGPLRPEESETGRLAREAMESPGLMPQPQSYHPAKRPWLKFFPSDWRSDAALHACSSGARGLWIEMLCLMHEANPSGSLLLNGRQMTPKQLASLSGVPLKEVMGYLTELGQVGVLGRDEDGTIFSRRMRGSDTRPVLRHASGPANR